MSLTVKVKVLLGCLHLAVYNHHIAVHFGLGSLCPARPVFETTKALLTE